MKTVISFVRSFSFNILHILIYVHFYFSLLLRTLFLKIAFGNNIYILYLL